MRKLVAIGTLAAMALGAQAAAAAEGISYNLLEGQYISGDTEGFDFDGFGVHGSFAFAPTFHVFGDLKNLDYDGGGSLDLMDIGLGWNTAVSETWDVFVRGSFERWDAGPSESGWGVGAGLRGRVMGSLELSAQAKYSDIGDAGDFTTFMAGGRWYFTPAFAAGADYMVMNGDNADSDAFVLSLRYDFGGM